MQMELGRETEWCWPSTLSHRAVLDFTGAAVSGCLLFRPLLGDEKQTSGERAKNDAPHPTQTYCRV
jgi:hypothetical protein